MKKIPACADCKHSIAERPDQDPNYFRCAKSERTRKFKKGKEYHLGQSGYKLETVFSYCDHFRNWSMIGELLFSFRLICGKYGRYFEPKETS